MDPKTRKAGTTKQIVTKLLYNMHRTDEFYDFVCADDNETVLVELDTTSPVGPISAKANWVIRVNPHPRAQEIAEAIWEELDWSEVPEDSIDPYSQDCATSGWYCIWIVKIEY
jgi:hypothetical protein